MTRKLSKKTEIGTVFCASSLTLRVNYGNAEDQETGIVYELATSLSGLPIITSSHTGQKWNIGWHELIALAVKNGIDKPFADISEVAHAA